MAAHTDDLSLLRQFHREKLAARERHVAVARVVSDYEFNNTYQYIINREDTHLSWLESAIAELGGTPESVAAVSVTAGAGKGSEKFLPLVQEDSRAAERLVAEWKPKVAAIGSDRHRKMVGVVLGETLEQKRFFDQMLAGREDLLGRRMAGASTGDGVMPVRWVE